MSKHSAHRLFGHEQLEARLALDGGALPAAEAIVASPTAAVPGDPAAEIVPLAVPINMAVEATAGQAATHGTGKTLPATVIASRLDAAADDQASRGNAHELTHVVQQREPEAAARDGNDLLIVNNGDGSDLAPEERHEVLLDGSDPIDASQGQDGNDLLIVNNGDGSDLLNQATDAIFLEAATRPSGAYFDGRFLNADDFTQEQEYAKDSLEASADMAAYTALVDLVFAASDPS